MLIAIYDPRRLSEGDFLAGFVARHDTANFLLEQLRHATPSDEVRHRLIVGQRGMGKTSLLRRIAIGISHDEKLCERYIPLTFREEQYNVRHIDRFWRNCGEALAEWMESAGDNAGATEIDLSLDTEKWKKPGAACREFVSYSAKLGKQPILLVDNVDLILEALPSEQRWQLRRTLQMRGGPILYGTSTQLPRDVGDRNEAFYEFFQIHQLEALTEAELLDCMLRLVEVRGESGKPVREVLERQPERLRALHTLTGGNPRVLILIYQLLERAESATVFTDLETLLDQMTPFYKARIEELKSELPRSIVDAIALNWDPITSNGISKITEEPITTVSSQLSRLRNMGIIEEVATSGSRAGYQLVERFFNIWYLMRHGTRRTRHRMRWLAAFLESFYSINELRHLREVFSSEKHDPAFSLCYDEAIAEAMVRCSSAPTGSRRMDVDVVETQRPTPEAPGLEASLKTAVEVNPNSAANWTALADFLENSTTRFTEARAAYLKATEISPNAAEVWWRLGRLLRDDLKEYEEAERAYRRSIEVDPNYVRAWVGLGRLLYHHFNQYSEAEFAFRRALQLQPDHLFARLGLGQVKDEVGEYDEAEAAYRYAIKIDPKNDRAWGSLGDMLTHKLHRYDQAEATYRQGLDANPKSAFLWADFGHLLGTHLRRLDEAEVVSRRATELRPTSAYCWLILGSVLYRRGSRGSEAETSLRRAIELDPKYAAPWYYLGNVLAQSKRYDEAEDAYRHSIHLNAADALSWGNLAGLLHYERGQLDEAKVAYHRAIELDPKSVEVRIQLGTLLDKQKRYEESENVYRRALEIEPTSAHAWLHLSWVLHIRNQRNEAEAALRRAVDVQPNYAPAWLALGRLLQEDFGFERFNEAEAALRKAIELNPRRYPTWLALANFLKDCLSRYGESERAYREALRIEPNSALVWNGLANLLQDHLGQFEEAERAYERVIEISPKYATLAKANLFWLEAKLGNVERAAQLRKQLTDIDAFGAMLADAAIELMQDNFGAMTNHLGVALADNPLNPDYFDDLLRLLRMVKQREYGPRLIDWLKEKGYDAVHAPVYAAFMAYVRGSRQLFDFNPEVRGAAERIYNWLTSKEAPAELVPADKGARRADRARMRKTRRS
jgi:tetratricopeptide (TPR) repeat protein